MNIDRLDLNLLRVLNVLLREQHVSRAATTLHLSQPATSAALARLRDALGDPLLVRTARGMQPTARAIALAPQIRALLQSVSAVLTPAQPFNANHSDLTFTVAATDYIIELINNDLALTLRKGSPNLKFAWRSLALPNLLARLETGEIDLAITSSVRTPDALHARKLVTETFVGIAAKGNRFVGNSTAMKIDAFCSQPHVVVSISGVDPFKTNTDDLLAKRGLSRHVAFSVPQFRFAVDMVENTDVIAVFPERLARRFADRIQIFALPIQTQSFDIVMAWHEISHRSAAHQWLRSTIQAVVQ